MNSTELVNMSPPSATESYAEFQAVNNESKSASVTVKAEGGEPFAVKQKLAFPKPPTFDDKYEERKYLKGRLAAAFRIFGKYGFDEGVAGHITVRVRIQKIENAFECRS